MPNKDYQLNVFADTFLGYRAGAPDVKYYSDLALHRPRDVPHHERFELNLFPDDKKASTPVDKKKKTDWGVPKSGKRSKKKKKPSHPFGDDPFGLGAPPAGPAFPGL